MRNAFLASFLAPFLAPFRALFHTSTPSSSIALGGVVLVSVLSLGCQSFVNGTPNSVDVESNLGSATNAYRAYERGDCDAVSSSAIAAGIERWDPSEMRHSFQLLKGFCQELARDSRAARETYRLIIREAPLSFASDDARERLRILRRAESDPDYNDWVMAARQRATGGTSPRDAVRRIPASFPPLAHRAGVGGYAVVEFGVTPRGDTEAPVVVDSKPPLLFDGVAIRAVREWRYAFKQGGSEAQRQAIRLVFRPEDPHTEPATGSTSQ